MKFSFITLFPNIIKCYFSDSILNRAIKEELIELEFVNPRDFSQDRYKKVDAPKIGGGAGMLLTPQPISDAILATKKEDSHIIFLTPAAKKFNSLDAKRLAKKSHIILVSGRYEGFDERLIELYANEIFSIGDFILTGGEIGALAIADSISRYIPGVLGNSDSLVEESFEGELLEAPAFTKPDLFKEKRVISEFLKGNHSKISAIKKELALLKTKYYRPDLYRTIKVMEDEK